jgi:hypothetical protein
VPVLPSASPLNDVAPAKGLRSSESLTIAFAGTMYALDEWKCLLAALDLCGWKILGREVTIRVMSNALPQAGFQPVRIEYLGFRSQPETIRSLSQADFLYCPYWFDKSREVEARECFPSKLPTYLCSGRPVLFHGPEYASPASFLKPHHAAFFCHSNHPAALAQTLERASEDGETYASIVRNGVAVFHKYLTPHAQRRSFAHFLELEEACLLEAA